MFNHRFLKLSKLLIFILTLNTFVTNFSFAQNANQSEIKDKITAYMENLEKSGFNGAILIELNGIKIISTGFGFADKSKNLKNNSNTVFDIGSVTKQFTATAILGLEAAGRLHIDDPISKYFDSTPTDKKNITIHDLLRHQSGLVSNIGGDYEPITNADFIDRVFNSQLLFSPGRNFSYSNIGYSLLALIIEHVSDSSYEEYLISNFFDKAGMETTGYSTTNINPADVAVGYKENFKIWGKPTEKKWDGNQPYLHLLGNGGMLSTVEDLYKWHQALINNKILSVSSINKQYNPRLREGENENPYYAYGWDILKTTRQTTQTWHNGTNEVFYADFLRLVDEDITVIMLSNKADPDFNNISKNIVKMIFEKDFKPQIPTPKSPENIQLTTSVIEAIERQGFNDAKNLYLNKKKETQIIEPLLNQKGYQLISENNIETAILVFKFNAYTFPESWNAFDSLGEAYFLNKNFQQSLISYQKSFKLEPSNMNAKKMIEKLTSKISN